jgi:outer membrane biosynthesis protein TonB
MTPSGRRRTAGWILLALVGIAVAVALSLTASSLSTQPLGLSGEQLQAGDRLAPAERTVVTPKPKPKPKPAPARKRNTATATTPAPAPTQTNVAPVPTATAVTPVPTHTTTSDDGAIEPGDDHSGRGRSGSDD